MRPITASDLMNPKVLTVRDDMGVRDLASFLIENEISGAPVADAEGRLVGVVSLVDIAAVTSGVDRHRTDGSGFFGPDWDDGLDEEEMEDLDQDGLRVADIMTPQIFSVPEDATVSQIASLMLKGHLHRLLVTREDRAIGIITTSDLLGLLVGED
ncbi:MAG TPA: CBS domain-containing protein [Thermoanaerobaculia bacterium]|jgi:CBS domain-containing protein|nr:CBS domain-containing protein [Thermoanaerobaculia bacterium]